MKFIVASTAGCAIGPGERVRLTEAQIATRRHAVAVLDEKKGEVEPTTQIVFKRGEVIDLPAKFDELTSYHQSVLEPASKPKAAAEPKPVDPNAPGSGSVGGVDPNAGGNQSGSGSNAPNPAA